MFERYTQKARRSIFFARDEASQLGSHLIETEHLLLGLLREDAPLSSRFMQSHLTAESLRQQIVRHRSPPASSGGSTDPPLSGESKRALFYAAEEATLLDNYFIGTEHLLLGLLREEHGLARKLLADHNLIASAIRKDLQHNRPLTTQSRAPHS